MLLVGVLLHLDKPVATGYVASMPVDARLTPVHTPIGRLERVDELGMPGWVQQHPDALLPGAFSHATPAVNLRADYLLRPRHRRIGACSTRKIVSCHFLGMAQTNKAATGNIDSMTGQ
jgi:hypothetical protein